LSHQTAELEAQSLLIIYLVRRRRNMKIVRFVLISIFLFAAMTVVFAQNSHTGLDIQYELANRTTLAIKYPDDKESTIDMRGNLLQSYLGGRAEVKRDKGRTRIKLELEKLPHPQDLGSFYTTYVIWAVTPEGQADNLGEIPRKDRSSEITVTTPYETFALVVTAEPHGLVKYPSPVVAAENILRKDTKGDFTSSNVEYRGFSDSLYKASVTELPSDYKTPLSILGARRAVEIARRTGAPTYAEAEFKQAEMKLAEVERFWPIHRKDEEEFSSDAHEVMRLAEAARNASLERAGQARLAAERRAADHQINQAQSEADQARNEAERVKQQAEEYRLALARYESELVKARERESQAQTEAERAKAKEELARLEAERARLESERVKQERDQALQRLQVSLSEILETRREARGLIVSLSDVLFDFNKATLKPGTKEKLSKISGILLAYPGNYQLEIEGHTDAIGSDSYNQKLSEERAASVRDYIQQAGISATRIRATRGFGETKPVTTNDTPEGRQMNRRVEIVIIDSETAASLNQR
jgi:outer membrane protein OmpA-like peptidoglycan-associated protein